MKSSDLPIWTAFAALLCLIFIFLIPVSHGGIGPALVVLADLLGLFLSGLGVLYARLNKHLKPKSTVGLIMNLVASVPHLSLWVWIMMV